MTIGLPQAFMYHRYHGLWRYFFERLGCGVISSGDTTLEIARNGSMDSACESCLPAKIYLGHVRALIGRCDRVLVPRFYDYGRQEEMCPRLQGLYDVVRSTYPAAKLLAYNICLTRLHGETEGFVKMGAEVGAPIFRALASYRSAKREQRRLDSEDSARQKDRAIHSDEIKVLIAGRPYILHDSLLGGVVQSMIKEQGGKPLLSDMYDRRACRDASDEICGGLYWRLSRETVGAVALHGGDVDGIIMLSAFPCGGDALTGEMLSRKVSGVPVIRVVLDELRGDAGLQTRVESFLDILRERRRRNERAACY